MSKVCYKAVDLKRYSHYDGATRWRVGSVVRAPAVDPPEAGACGRGIHMSPTLLAAAGYQGGPSRYCEVEPVGIVCRDKTKLRCNGARVVRWLPRCEVDELAGMRLWETNNPVDPRKRTCRLTRQAQQRELKDYARAHASVYVSVYTSVRDSVRDSVYASVYASVRDSVYDSVRASVWDSFWGYTGSLFPRITKWKHTPMSRPWHSLRRLWLNGRVPLKVQGAWRLWSRDGLVEGIEVPSP